MHGAFFGRDEQLVEDQRVGLLAQAPEDHQHDDLQVFEVDRVRADRGGAVDHHLAHRRRQHAGRLEEADEADRLLAQQVMLGGGVHAHRLHALLARVALGRTGQAIKPGQRLLDLVALETGCRQLARELRMVGAGVRAPVGFVEIDQHIEHGADHYSAAITPCCASETTRLEVGRLGRRAPVPAGGH
jgi:hypothetical protein